MWEGQVTYWALDIPTYINPNLDFQNWEESLKYDELGTKLVLPVRPSNRHAVIQPCS